MRDVSHYGMPYCPIHNRLFPHPFVGWLTPHGIEGLAIFQALCDLCIKAQGGDILQHALPVVSTPAAGVDHRKT
jgi:hypothetical protein